MQKIHLGRSYEPSHKTKASCNDWLPEIHNFSSSQKSLTDGTKISTETLPAKSSPCV